LLLVRQHHKPLAKERCPVLRTIFASARDDGRNANSPLKAWFDQLANGRGLCCSFADCIKVENVDWDTQDGRYRVRLNGEWIVMPDNTVVTSRPDTARWSCRPT
jgi:hypothetical protein